MGERVHRLPESLGRVRPEETRGHCSEQVFSQTTFVGDVYRELDS